MPLKPTTAMRKDRAAGQVKMQHRHFAFIAAVIARIPSSEARLEAAMAFAGALGKTNPNFDRARFFTAVGLADPVIEQAAYPEEPLPTFKEMRGIFRK